MKPIITEVTRVGQPYFDDPIFDRIPPKAMVNAIITAFGGAPLRVVKIVIAYQHTKLRWMRPNGKGRLVPR